MIDFDRIEGFEWDEGNARKSEEKHGVSQAEAEQIFVNDPLLVFADDRHSVFEERFIALGKSNTGRLLTASFTLRHDQTKIRIISARDMHRKERGRYVQEA